jgi:hypothetical protein
MQRNLSLCADRRAAVIRHERFSNGSSGGRALNLTSTLDESIQVKQGGHVLHLIRARLGVSGTPSKGERGALALAPS